MPVAIRTLFKITMFGCGITDKRRTLKLRTLNDITQLHGGTA